ncbi:hypothetical protein NLD30_08345 [SCandidatus Aminicenantes bacterium Aminicenantia_JdfR_composite]|jgi:hypothetical protein|nr:hypothetical protein [SCandidatus Aminicenantes bacterium Aminicenantia_JdfR_composite]MCP2596848.1 hypothetical protein [Candidatus Aminicenantes bacterium AC-335-G13]MCP2605540.1 hypothetical protein [Candidatus Aminicenantes bacterium AC-335-O07]
MNYRKIFVFLALTFSLIILLVQTSGGKEGEPVLKKEIVKLKYIKASQVYDLLIPFRSKRGHILFNDRLNMITISDYPENVEKMLAVIKECDVKPKQLEFKIWLILAEVREKSKSINIPPIAKVIKELESFLKYNYYQLLDSSYLKTSESEYSSIILGDSYRFRLNVLKSKFIKDRKEEIINFSVRLTGKKGSLIESKLTLKNGETTVVGVSKMNGDNKGLILIITAKALD